MYELFDPLSIYGNLLFIPILTCTNARDCCSLKTLWIMQTKKNNLPTWQLSAQGMRQIKNYRPHEELNYIISYNLVKAMKKEKNPSWRLLSIYVWVICYNYKKHNQTMHVDRDHIWTYTLKIINFI
jgi:hypothetical protein